jgi:hypothetical protein
MAIQPSWPIDPRTVTIWRKPVRLRRRLGSDGQSAGRLELAGERRRRHGSPLDAGDVSRVGNAARYIDYFEIRDQSNPATITQTQRALTLRWRR